MKRVWFAYSWKDNQGPDAGTTDYIIQELGQRLEVHCDRNSLVAGLRLWDQIGANISNPQKVDGLVLLLTQSSLSSESCREELAYGIDRALSSRGGAFPIVPLALGKVDWKAIPPALRVRLGVSTDEPDWISRVVNGIEGNPGKLTTEKLKPYMFEVCRCAMNPENPSDRVVVVGPRLGSWSPFVIGLPEDEKGRFLDWTFAGPGCVNHTAGKCFSSNDFVEDGFFYRRLFSPVISASTRAHIFLRTDGRPLEVRVGTIPKVWIETVL